MAKVPKLFRFPASLVAEIERAAAARGITQTALVERACKAFLTPEQAAQPVQPTRGKLTPAPAEATRGLTRQQRRARARAAAKMR